MAQASWTMKCAEADSSEIIPVSQALVSTLNPSTPHPRLHPRGTWRRPEAPSSAQMLLRASSSCVFSVRIGETG